MGIKLAIHAGLAFISGLLVVRTKEHEIDITELRHVVRIYV